MKVCYISAHYVTKVHCAEFCLLYISIKLLPEKNSGYFNENFVPMIKSMVKLCLPEFSDFTSDFSLKVKVLCNRPLVYLFSPLH